MIFVPSQLLLASALFPPVLVRHAASLVPRPISTSYKKVMNVETEGLEMRMLFFASIDGQILQSVLVCIDLHGSIVAEQLNQN